MKTNHMEILNKGKRIKIKTWKLISGGKKKIARESE